MGCKVLGCKFIVPPKAILTSEDASKLQASKCKETGDGADGSGGSAATASSAEWGPASRESQPLALPLSAPLSCCVPPPPLSHPPQVPFPAYKPTCAVIDKRGERVVSLLFARDF